MNALANSQMDELTKFIGQVPGERPVTFERYSGQEDGSERRRIAEEPPDILLTNFMMLELLMTRQEEIDRRVIGNCAGASLPGPGRAAHVPRPSGCERSVARAPGHAVAIAGEGGCFQCNIGRTGAPSFTVVDWPDGGDGRDGRQEEPVCGVHYHPYGPVELNYVTAMIGDVALECLLSPPTRSFSRVFVTSQCRIDELGARWSDEWSDKHGYDHEGMRTVDRPWLRTACPACGEQPVDEAA